MKKLVLVRHGESLWNKENRFTGWTDIDLSTKGIEEAREAGRKLKAEGFEFGIVFTSVLKRAIRTMWLILDEMDLMWLPVNKSWRLNEKHYGMLQGLNKVETAEKYGDEQVHLWRRSYDIPPAPLDQNDPRNPAFDRRYKDIPADEIPLTEALKDTINRMLPYWENEIKPALLTHNEVLVVAHGNSLRGVVKVLKNISNQDILEMNIPTGIPYVFEFDDQLQLQKDYYLADEETLKQLMEAVANQAKKK